MKMKRSTLAAAVIAAAAIGSAGQASASVYAGAYTAVQDLNLVVYNETTLDQTGISVSNYTFTANSSADLNGGADLDNSTCSTLGTACTGPAPVLQSVANGTGSAPVRTLGDFSLFGPSANTYANAGAQIGEAELVTGNPTTANQIAEAEIQASGFGTAGTTVSSQTSFVFDFAVTSTTAGLTLSFEADPFLHVAVNTDDLLGALAQASISATFSLLSSDGSVDVTWTPSGNATGFAACDGVGSCTELADAEDLTRTISLPPGNPVSLDFSPGAGFGLFNIAISGIPEGSYSLGLTLTSFVRAEQTVPEPGMLSLLGIGLMGLGASVRRRRAAK